MPTQKATKFNDAGVQVHLWDDRIQEKLTEHWVMKENLKGRFLSNHTRNFQNPMENVRLKHALWVLRKFGLTVWKSNLKRDFKLWYRTTYSLHPECLEIKMTGNGAVDWAFKASWWEWDKGSSLFFWGWPEGYQDIA